MTKICVLDYGVGNLRSVANAILESGGDAVISDSVDVASEAEGVVVPGVGAFPHVRERLLASGLDRVVLEAVARGKPVLGICVGMQLLFDRGCEFEDVPGLGLIPGIVERVAPLNASVRLPHIAWTKIQPCPAVEAGMFSSSEDLGEQRFYFLHSFTARHVPLQYVAATASYEGYGVVAAVRKGMLWGSQFHPEKSGQAGLRFLRSFVSVCRAHADVTR